MCQKKRGHRQTKQRYGGNGGKFTEFIVAWMGWFSMVDANTISHTPFCLSGMDGFRRKRS